MSVIEKRNIFGIHSPIRTVVSRMIPKPKTVQGCPGGCGIYFFDEVRFIGFTSNIPVGKKNVYIFIAICNNLSVFILGFDCRICFPFVRHVFDGFHCRNCLLSFTCNFACFVPLGAQLHFCHHTLDINFNRISYSIIRVGAKIFRFYIGTGYLTICIRIC